MQQNLTFFPGFPWMPFGVDCFLLSLYLLIYIYILNETNNGPHPWLTHLSIFCTSLYFMPRLKWATLPQWPVIHTISFFDTLAQHMLRSWNVFQKSVW